MLTISSVFNHEYVNLRINYGTNTYSDTLHYDPIKSYMLVRETCWIAPKIYERMRKFCYTVFYNNTYDS